MPKMHRMILQSKLELSTILSYSSKEKIGLQSLNNEQVFTVPDVRVRKAKQGDKGAAFWIQVSCSP